MKMIIICELFGAWVETPMRNVKTAAGGVAGEDALGPNEFMPTLAANATSAPIVDFGRPGIRFGSIGVGEPAWMESAKYAAHGTGVG